MWFHYSNTCFGWGFSMGKSMSNKEVVVKTITKWNQNNLKWKLHAAWRHLECSKKRINNLCIQDPEMNFSQAAVLRNNGFDPVWDLFANWTPFLSSFLHLEFPTDNGEKNLPYTQLASKERRLLSRWEN